MNELPDFTLSSYILNQVAFMEPGETKEFSTSFGNVIKVTLTEKGIFRFWVNPED